MFKAIPVALLAALSLSSVSLAANKYSNEPHSNTSSSSLVAQTSSTSHPTPRPTYHPNTTKPTPTK